MVNLFSIKYKRMKVEDNPEAMTASQFKIQVPQMCSNIHYFIVFPYSHDLIQENTNKDNQIVMLTYSSQLTKIKDLIKRYKQKRPQLEGKEIEFTLSKGYALEKEWTVKRFKKALKRDYLDGLAFFINIQSTNSSSYVEQCCVANYIYQQPEYNPNSQQLKINFSLPSKGQMVVSVTTDSKESIENVIKKLIEQVKEQVGVSITQSSIKQFRIAHNNNILDRDLSLEQNEVYAQDLIEVVFKNTSLIFSNSDSSLKNNKELIIVYKTQKETKQQMLPYQDIKNMQISYICGKYFNLEKKDFRQENQICLRIMDLIIKPTETLWKAWKYFMQTHQTDHIKIVGHIVNQRKIFNSILTELQKKTTSGIKYKDIEPSPQKRQQLQKRLRERANKLKNDKHFKDIENLQPIYLYTSEAKAQNQQNTIYCSVNLHLRQKSILDAKPKQLQKDWKIKFTSNLVSSLKKIEDQYKMLKVYRGVNYRIDKKEGDIITFKSFLSTTTKIQIAQSIAKNNKIKQEKNGQKAQRNKVINKDYSIFIMTIKNGKSISKYSQFPQEDQILLLPFTQFRITKIDKSKEFHEYHMEQVGVRDESLEQMRGNFILWIDDKVLQGKFLFQKISRMEEPLVFKQFLSTQQFQQWLVVNKKLLDDPTANILVISNMKRIQRGIQNPTAGLQSLKKLQSFTTNIPVIFYVGYKPATKEHLQKNGFLNSGMDIKICNDIEELEGHIKIHIKTVKFVRDKVQDKLYKSYSSNESTKEPALQSQKSVPQSAQNQTYCEIQ